MIKPTKNDGPSSNGVEHEEEAGKHKENLVSSPSCWPLPLRKVKNTSDTCDERALAGSEPLGGMVEDPPHTWNRDGSSISNGTTIIYFPFSDLYQNWYLAKYYVE